MEPIAPQTEMNSAEILRSMGVRDPHRKRLSLEVLGEIVLLVIVAAFFAYLFISSLNWTLGAALTPRIAVALGMPFLIYRMVLLLRHTQASPAQIMDMGFRIGTDPTAERARLVRIALFIVGLYFAIWMVGFHLALPAGMFFYLMVYGRAGIVWSLLISLIFLAIIIGLYDSVLRMHWHQPVLYQFLGIR